MSNRRFQTCLGTATLIGVVVLIPSSSVAAEILTVPTTPPVLAGAVFANTRCPANSACMFEHVNYGGLVFTINRAGGGRGEDSSFHDNPCVGPRGDCRSSKHRNSNGTWGDQASSVHNRLNRRFCFYKNTRFGGDVIKIQAGQRTNLPGSFNDELSSGRPC